MFMKNLDFFGFSWLKCGKIQTFVISTEMEVALFYSSNNL